MLHICAHCFRHGNHHLRHQESACNRKGGKARTHHHQGKKTHRIVRSRSPPSTPPMSLPQPSQPALPPAPGLPLSSHSLPDCPLPPHWLQQTDRLDDTSFQPSDFTQLDLHVDDSLQPTDHSHHPPVAAPSHHSHVGGATTQDLLFPARPFQDQGRKGGLGLGPQGLHPCVSSCLSASRDPTSCQH